MEQGTGNESRFHVVPPSSFRFLIEDPPSGTNYHLVLDCRSASRGRTTSLASAPGPRTPPEVSAAFVRFVRISQGSLRVPVSKLLLCFAALPVPSCFVYLATRLPSRRSCKSECLFLSRFFRVCFFCRGLFTPASPLHKV